MRWPGRVAETLGFVFSRKFQQFFERSRHRVHACVRIADLREALRDPQYRKVGWLAVRYLLPVKRRGHTGIGERAHGIRRARRSTLGVLVLFKEHAMTLLIS